MFNTDDVVKSIVSAGRVSDAQFVDPVEDVDVDDEDDEDEDEERDDGSPAKRRRK